MKSRAHHQVQSLRTGVSALAPGASFGRRGRGLEEQLIVVQDGHDALLVSNKRLCLLSSHGLGETLTLRFTHTQH